VRRPSRHCPLSPIGTASVLGNLRSIRTFTQVPVIRHERPAPASHCALSPGAREAGLFPGADALGARLPSAPPQWWPISSGRSVRTDDDFAARGMVSRRRSSQMAARRHNAGSKCEANSRLISKGCQ